MRILFITNAFPNPHQPTRGIFNLSLARELARAHDLRVIAPIQWTEELRFRRIGQTSISADRTEKRDGMQISFPRYFYPPKVMRRHYGWFYWHSVRRTVKRVLTDFRPDVVLAYWAHPDGEAAVRVGRLIGVPVVVIVGGSDGLLLTANPGRRRRVRNVLQCADAVVTVGADLKERIVALGIDPDSIYIVRRGIDTGLFTPGDQGAARDRVGVPPRTKVLLWVGRMEPVKGLDVLLETCTRLQQRDFAFRLYLVGDGSLKNALEEDCRRRGLCASVAFVGSVPHEQLPDWYRAADITVLPSRSEGVPNVLRESLACGTPFVASRVGGIPELAEGAVHGLVPPGDPAALAEALQRVLGRPEKQPVVARVPDSWAESAEAMLCVLRPLVRGSSVSIAASRAN